MVFRPQIKIGLFCPNGVRGDGQAFNQRERIAGEDVAVFKGADFPFIGVADQVSFSPLGASGPVPISNRN